MLQWISKVYDEVWYHSQFWVDKYLRRPFTLTMRDCIHYYPGPAALIILLIAAGLFYLCMEYLLIGFFLTAFYFFLLGHVCWTDWTPGEQENPTYIEKT